MKKLLTLGVLVAGVALFAGCMNKPATTDTTTTDTTTTDTTTPTVDEVAPADVTTDTTTTSTTTGEVVPPTAETPTAE